MPGTDPDGKTETGEASRIDALAAFAHAFWANRGILREPAWRQDRLFLRCALAILTQKQDSTKDNK